MVPAYKGDEGLREKTAMCAGKGPFHRQHAGKHQNGLMGTVSGTARGLRRFLGSANVG